MGKYIYIDKDSKKGRFGIASEVFRDLTYDVLSRVPGLIIHREAEGRAHHQHHHKHTHINEVIASIHHGVVNIDIDVVAKEGSNLVEAEKQIKEEVVSLFMMMTEQVPVSVKVKIAE